MPNYRRATVAGATWFFTVTLANRSSSLLTERIADLRTTFSTVRAELPFRCDALNMLGECWSRIDASDRFQTVSDPF